VQAVGSQVKKDKARRKGKKTYWRKIVLRERRKGASGPPDKEERTEGRVLAGGTHGAQ